MSDDSTFDLGKFAKDMIEGVAETVEKTVDQVVPDAPVDMDVVRSQGGTLGSTYAKDAFEPLDDASSATAAPAAAAFESVSHVLPESRSNYVGAGDEPNVIGHNLYGMESASGEVGSFGDRPADEVVRDFKEAFWDSYEDAAEVEMMRRLNDPDDKFEPPPSPADDSAGWFDADAPARLLETINDTVNETVPNFVSDLFVEKDISDLAEEMVFEPDQKFSGDDREPDFQSFKQVGADDTIDEYRNFKLIGGIDPAIEDPDAAKWKLDGLKDDGLVDEQWKLDGLKLDGLKDDGLDDAMWKPDGLKDDGLDDAMWKPDGLKDDGLEVEQQWKLDGLKLDGLKDDGLEMTLMEGAVEEASMASFIPDVAVTPSPAGPIPVPYPNISESPRDVASAPAESTPIDPQDSAQPSTPPEADFAPVEVDFDPVDQDALDAVWSGLTDDAATESSSDDAATEWGE